MSSEGLGKTRMEAISDGVFAVAMTLMLADAVTKEGVKEWRTDWFDKSLLFLVTFGITSTYWIAHNNECRHVKKTDRLVLWLNLLFVAAVAFIPASVSMFGQPGPSDLKAFTLIYLWNLVLMGVFLEAWFVSLWREGFLTGDGSRQRWSTAFRNAVLPLAFGVLLVAVWQQDADWWLVDHIRWALLVPLVSYVLMTLFLRSDNTSWHPTIKSALLLLLFCDGVLFLIYPKLRLEFVIGSIWLFLLVLMIRFFVESGHHREMVEGDL